MRFMQATLVCCLTLAAAAMGSGLLSVEIGSQGSAILSVNGKQWLSTNETEVFTAGAMQNASSGALEPGPTTTTTGFDSYGTFKRVAQDWTVTATGEAFTTAIRDYTAHSDLVVFEQNYPSGIASLEAADKNAAGTAYPVLQQPAAAAPPTLGYLTWAGNMACPGAEKQCTFTGPLDSWTTWAIPGGIDGGAPLVLFDDSPEQATMVIAPASNFMAASHVYSTGAVQAGVLGSVTSIPAGWSVEFSVTAGRGVTDTMLAWGRGLLARYGKQPMQVPGDGRDRTVDMLSYYTDNGAGYYYCTEENKTYADTLVDVAKHAAGFIPYRAMQIDSWWYFKSPVTNGVVSWTPMPSVFPYGLEAVHKEIGMPFVAHNRYWDAHNVYATQNGGSYQFIVEERLAIPTEEQFWVDLFQNGTKWGLAVYEQDWLHNEFEELNATLTSATLGREWLLQMGRGAEAAEITIQYCMPYPRHVLQSVEVPAVTQSRASDDYSPQNDQWSIGVSSLLYHALGLAPWKDDTWTSTRTQTCPSGTHHYKHESETAPELELMVSALSTGPVGPSDLIGMEDADAILRTCTANGVILKPSVPATAIDATFAQRAFGSGGPQGELWTSYSDVSGQRFHQVLCASLDAPFAVLPSMLKGAGAPSDSASQVAYRFNSGYGPSPGPITYSTAKPIQCPANDKTSPNLWYTAPVLPSGHALLGEMDKYVPVSPLRFTDLVASDDGFSVRVTGSEGETVNVYVAMPGPEPGKFHVSMALCRLKASGSAILRMPEASCLPS
ncbi:hypothetical protein FNF29_06521 [Cafeteria roenbergensis]|uniref:Uncharacterized protein n=1 Tax=Cafeteria roenbergensis TaxID=33653 RepID=A0A5A8C853_CAFRO|nr:hypothetical protein FNF29_06521 [Cafeteria roenbergensis]|eukprot:KAA0148739.1 hypothetical protein FNF29_06521 [Cafeteria roenbergensis]